MKMQILIFIKHSKSGLAMIWFLEKHSKSALAILCILSNMPNEPKQFYDFSKSYPIRFNNFLVLLRDTECDLGTF